MKRLLFVCMGNICRSPAAECVMRQVLAGEGAGDRYHCDSAGTHGYHIGNPPDRRMRGAGQRRGIAIDGRARQVSADDLEQFDLVLAMDRDNLRHLKSLDPSGRHHAKLKLMTDFLTEQQAGEVPDPYYGGEDGFELVLDLLEDSCRGLLDHLENDNRSSR